MQSLLPPGDSRGLVALFVPRWRTDASQPQGTPVQALPVASALLRNGYAVALISEEHDGQDSDAIRRAIDSATAAAVWSNAFDAGPQIHAIQQFFESVRQRRPDLPRILGGGFLATMPETFHLEGLAERVSGSDPWALADHLGAVSDRKFTADALSGLDLSKFAAPSPLRFGNGEPALALPTGTGCGRSCPFCVHEHAQEHLLTASTIADLMVQNYHRHSIRQFSLAEQDFLAHPARAIELAESIARRGLPLRWTVAASVPDVLAISDDQLDTLVDAGLVGVELGVEVGSDSALTKLGKSFRVVHTVRAHDRLIAKGIDPIHDMLFGWPGETNRDRRATLDFVDRLNRTGRAGAFRFRRYRAVPTTSYGDAALRFGGPQPMNLKGLAALDLSERTMPWLSTNEERRVRLLTGYILPMAYRTRATAPVGRNWRTLSTLARLRCRTGWMALPVDRAIFAKSGDPVPTAS